MWAWNKLVLVATWSLLTHPSLTSARIPRLIRQLVFWSRSAWEEGLWRNLCMNVWSISLSASIKEECSDGISGLGLGWSALAGVPRTFTWNHPVAKINQLKENTLFVLITLDLCCNHYCAIVFSFLFLLGLVFVKEYYTVSLRQWLAMGYRSQECGLCVEAAVVWIAAIQCNKCVSERVFF